MNFPWRKHSRGHNLELVSGFGYNPLLLPDQTWEETAVYEPCVHREDGLFKMWYSGGWDNPAIGYATSPGGFNGWTKHSGAVIGQGASSISGTACRINVIKSGATYYAYYADTNGPSANLKLATSSDGIAWTAVGTAVANNAVGGFDGWANSSILIDGGTWHMLLEGHASSGFPVWAMFYLTSSDGATWTFQNSSNPLTTLRIATGGMYGGPCLLKIGSTYHVYYHASSTTSAATPTDIYHATSVNLINWTVSGSPTAILTHSSTGIEGGDQIADPSVLEVGGRVYMFYDGTENAAESGGIGAAYFDGTLAGGGTFVRLGERDYTDPVEAWEMHEASGSRAGSVNALTLTDNGGVSSATGNSGQNAAVMTGSQGLSRASEALIQLGNYNFTFTGWVKFSAVDSFGVIATKYNTSGVDNRQFYAYLENPAKVRVAFWANAGGSTNGAVQSDNFGALSANVWYFVAFWHDADNNEVGVSINAGTANTTSYAGGVHPTGNGPLRFGFDGTTNAATRNLERWRFYRRVLSGAELTAMYNAGAGVNFP